MSADPALLNDLAARCRPFVGGQLRPAALQIAGDLFGLVGLYALMAAAQERGAWWALPLLWGPAAILLTRTFVLQHDAGHGSLLPSRRANDAVGRLCSLFTFTPYAFWRLAHALHHKTSGDLDRHGVGDVFTATVAEFNAMPPGERRAYRRFRDVRLMILLGAPVQFLLRYRTPWLQRLPPARCWRSIVGLDLGLLALYGPLCVALGPGRVAAMVLPVVVLTTWVGGWMFFIQHQFKGAWYRRHGAWSPLESALRGSSFYDLPPLLHWCTGNIGVHHVHHLYPGIPNYRLQACLDAAPELRALSRLSLAESIGCGRLALWDEASHRLLSFADAEAEGLIPAG